MTWTIKHSFAAYGALGWALWAFMCPWWLALLMLPGAVLWCWWWLT